MAASLTQTLIDKEFRNWIKGALAVLLAREGLTDFAQNEITDFQNDLLNDVWTAIGIPAGTKCIACTTENVLVCPTQGFCTKGKKCTVHNPKISNLKPNQPCPHHMCTALRDAILKEHRYRGPSWRNTDARGWCTDAYQLAKCYMPPDGYADKASLAETDFNGVIAVVINNKRFEKILSANFSRKTNICEQARIAGREIRHSATHQLSDKDLVSYIDVFIQLLSDPVYLVKYAKAIDAVQKLKQLKTNTLTIHADDITSVLNDSIKATFNDQQNALLREIQEHFNVHKKDSVEAIDLQVQKFVETGNVELNARIKQGKDEINSKVEKGKGEISVQTEQGKDEINSKVEKGKGELNFQTELGKDEIHSKVEKGKGELNAQTEQGKGELSLTVEKGKSELSAQTEQEKSELNSKVEKGKDELSAQTKQGIGELSIKVEKGKGELSAQTKQGKDEINSKLEKGKGELSAQIEKVKGELSLKVEKGKNELSAQTEEGKCEINSKVEKGKDELSAQTEKGKGELSLKVEKGKGELSAQTEQGKDEINSKVGKGKDGLSAQTEQGKDELSFKVEKGKGELSAQTEQGKCELNLKVEKGKGELSSQTEQGKDELCLKVEKGKVELSARTEQGLGELHAQIKQGADELKVHTSDGKDELSSHIAMGKNKIEAKTNQGKEEIEARGKQVSEEISRPAVLKKGYNDDSLLQGATTKKTQIEYGFWDKITFKELRLRSEFKQELVRFYNEKESMIPASPLVEDYAVPLTELYVQPPMSAFVRPNAFGQGNKHSEKTPVRSYRELFLNDNNILYKNIYVEANAGYGKTSFTQKVAMTWCQAQQTFNLMNRNLKKKEVYTLTRFEFLFLLHLRDFQGETCNLDELILKFVSRNLPNKEQYSEQFIANILQNKTCLVIIDGLDEWVHPETCSRTPGIPHNNYRGSCTVLTTTRPWKLSTLGLPPNLIDRHLEISPLDDTTSNELKSNAVKLLCKNSDTNQPDLTDFDSKVSSVKLGDIRLIPYILLQLICIWFDGLSIGKSKCETYSNTIELTLQRGLNKKNAPIPLTGNAERNYITIPECMRHNALCEQYKSLLLKLGKLAFYALFQKIKESSLVIDSTTVLKFLTEKELEFCLKIGLLSQSKDRSLVSVKRYQVFFQHKSLQEFMAALYITSEWNKGTIKSTIVQVCSSISSILEMENLFVFVCGMNPDVYTCISGELQTIVKRYRITDQFRIMLAYQSMQVQCFQESVRNGNDNGSIPLQHFAIHNKTLTEDDVTALVKIIDCTIVHTSSGDKTIGLQSLDLAEVCMTHSNLKCLYAVISQTTTLTQLKLWWIYCSDHRGQYRDCDVTLDLHRQNELKMLHLYYVPCRKLLVNPACLEKLEFWSWEEMTARASATLWQDLRAAPILSSLTLYRMSSCQEMIQTIPTLTQLQHLELVGIYMGDDIPLSPAMTQLKHVELREVKMSSAAWRELLLSFGQLQHPVTVKLNKCEGPSKEEWRTIVNVIKTTPTLSLLHDFRIDRWDASLTLIKMKREL